LKGWRNVTLIGTPSGGGSGRAIPLTLRNSAIALRLSSMASFQRDGKLYDGRGVEPDVMLQPAAGDWIGKTDTALDAAVKQFN
jgi:C-terminal processing protease CtpA/Prc